MLEVDALEGLARFAVGAIEGHFGQRALRLAAGENPLYVFELDLLVEGSESEILDRALQLDEIAMPWVVAQGIERGNRQPPRRAGACFDEQREHQRGQVGFV